MMPSGLAGVDASRFDARAAQNCCRGGAPMSRTQVVRYPQESRAAAGALVRMLNARRGLNSMTQDADPMHEYFAHKDLDVNLVLAYASRRDRAA